MDEKSMKISPIEKDFSSGWNLDYFSDDDVYLNAELWSHSGPLDQYAEFNRSSSDYSDRTFSSCSWHNDEFDIKSSSKVHASLEAIEDALYENKKSPFIKDILYQECCDWSERFPYLRLKGNQIKSYCAENVDSSVKDSSKNGMHSPFSLHIEGKKIPIYPNNKHLRGIQLDVDSSFRSSPSDIQEITEECFIHHKNECTELSPQVIVSSETNAKSLSMKAVQEQILEKIVLKVWKNVLTSLENLDKKSEGKADFQLPPIVCQELQKDFYVERPKTEGTSVSNEFPRLENNLPAFLSEFQVKRVSKINLTRPCSEMSVNRLKSSNESTLSWHFKGFNSVKKASINCFLREGKPVKEAETMSFILPVLEEDNQDSGNILRGVHIGPEVSSKIDSSCDKNLECNNYSKVNHLPPIVDNKYLSSNTKLTKNLFAFYDSSIHNEASITEATKNMRIKSTSRPSTSCKTMNSRIPLQKSRSYLTSRNVHKTSGTKSLQMDDGGTIKSNRHKSITLFPIVTPLTPHEDKSTKNLKKDLLHNFLIGKKSKESFK